MARRLTARTTRKPKPVPRVADVEPTLLPRFAGDHDEPAEPAPAPEPVKTVDLAAGPIVAPVERVYFPPPVVEDRPTVVDAGIMYASGVDGAILDEATGCPPDLGTLFERTLAHGNMVRCRRRLISRSLRRPFGPVLDQLFLPAGAEITAARAAEIVDQIKQQAEDLATAGY